MYFIAVRKQKQGTHLPKTHFAKFLREKNMSSSFIHSLKRNFSSAAHYSTKAWFRTEQINVLTNFKQKASFHRKSFPHLCRKKLGSPDQVFNRGLTQLPRFRNIFRSPMYFIAVRKKTGNSITQNSQCQIFNRKKNVFLICTKPQKKVVLS